MVAGFSDWMFGCKPVSVIGCLDASRWLSGAEAPGIHPRIKIIPNTYKDSILNLLLLCPSSGKLFEHSDATWLIFREMNYTNHVISFLH